MRDRKQYWILNATIFINIRNMVMSPATGCQCSVNGDPSLCLSLFLLLQFISWSALFQNATLNKPKQTKLSDVTKEIIVWIHTIQYCAGVCIRSAGGGSICCGSIHYININHRRPDCVASVGGEANLVPRDSLCGSGSCMHSYYWVNTGMQTYPNVCYSAHHHFLIKG